ncbi:MAG: Asp-tRNA(Asn)/Glu-tRNA(Gln) amidotransferase subunit GatA [Simkania negevensis]|nr:Asp-tRNA(Asn)/Glu-tRNA(Gln) amidotransferase subunit GatA [Simkania negevensis]
MYRKTATELHEAFIKGEETASSIISYFLERIQILEPDLGAFLNILSERVMAKAEELDIKKSQGKKCGKLAGIPIAIKDIIHIQGEITTCGSKFLSNYRAPFNASVIEEIEREDGLIIGKTNLDEFAMGSSTENSAYQLTRNPWNFSYSPGGSSGGSAAAVAARLSPLALGTDTGGSIRQPAAFCGTCGFKPTYGRVSRYGAVAFASSFDQIGPFANSVKDIALFMEVLSRPSKEDATNLHLPPEPYVDHLTTSIQGKKIGVPYTFLKDLSKPMKEAFENSLETFKTLGVEIIPIDLALLDYSLPVYYILTNAEASTNLARFDGIRYGTRSEKGKTLEEIYDFSRREGFGAEVKRRILLGTFVLSSGFQDAYYKKAQKVRTLIIREFAKAFETCDLIAIPPTPSPSFEIGKIQEPIEMYLQDIYTIFVNLAGLPAISIPTGLTKEKLPLSLQLIGPQLGDTKVLHFAYQFEKERKCAPLISPYFDKEVKL